MLRQFDLKTHEKPKQVILLSSRLILDLNNLGWEIHFSYEHNLFAH